MAARSSWAAADCGQTLRDRCSLLAETYHYHTAQGVLDRPTAAAVVAAGRVEDMAASVPHTQAAAGREAVVVGMVDGRSWDDNSQQKWAQAHENLAESVQDATEAGQGSNSRAVAANLRREQLDAQDMAGPSTHTEPAGEGSGVR